MEAEHETRVIILRGAGRAFCAGYDLTPSPSSKQKRSYKSIDEKRRTLIMGIRTSMQQITDIQMYFWNMAKVTIAQIHGYAVAGGCELSMMADLVVAANDAQLGHRDIEDSELQGTGSFGHWLLACVKPKNSPIPGKTSRLSKQKKWV